MLRLPEGSQTFATILGIDPGSETLGVGEIDFDLRTLEIVRCRAQTYTGSKLRKSSNWLEEVHSSRYKRLQAHRLNLIKLFDQIQPYLIACEAPFINMTRPQAYGALTEIVYEVRLAVIEHSSWKELYLIEPSTVKNGIGAKGNADKDAVRLSIAKIKELIDTLECPLSELDEHSIDALAVAYVCYGMMKTLAT